MSMYTAVSALKAQQTKLDVVGNNIANVNTIGYKGQNVSFSDLLSQTLSNSASANSASNRGGVNAQQVGLGVGLASVTTNMSTGSTEATGTASDLSISGSGFFIVEGAGSGTYQFTRAGNFGVDSSGNLVVDGSKVCGWEDYTKNSDGTYSFNTQGAVKALNLFTAADGTNKKIIKPQQTSYETLTGNLDPSATAQGTAVTTIGTVPTSPDSTTDMTVYDVLGNKYDVSLNISKCATGTVYDSSGNAIKVTTEYWDVSTSDSIITAAHSTGKTVTDSGYLAYDTNGKLLTGTYYLTVGGTAVEFSDSSSMTISPSSTSLNINSFDVKLNFKGISGYTNSSGYTVKASDSDGYASGDLEDFTISSDGIITGTYTNGQTQPLGQIGLAVFDNPEGLDKSGGNFYKVSSNSGRFTGGVIAGSGGSGELNSGTLEMSNVDLSAQFSEMMIAQRAYQASSKLISATDEMMKTVINMAS